MNRLEQIKNMTCDEMTKFIAAHRVTTLDDLNEENKELVFSAIKKWLEDEVK